MIERPENQVFFGLCFNICMDVLGWGLGVDKDGVMVCFKGEDT